MSVLGALPNLHPAVVHFPIALFVTAWGLDLAGLLLRRRVSLDAMAVILYFLALLAAGAAAFTGKLASQSFESLPVESEKLVGEHGDWAFFTLVAFFAVAILRWETYWRDRGKPGPGSRKMRLLALVAALAALVLLYRTIELGGTLVYGHGVGVSPGV